MLRFFFRIPWNHQKELSFLQIPQYSGFLSLYPRYQEICLGSAPCCKGNDEHHHQKRNGEADGRNTIQGNAGKHHARYEERSDGSTESIHRTNEVHALHRLSARQG